MGGGSATTWASVDGKPNKPFMSGMRARGRDAATRAALLRNKDAPEGLVRLRSDLSNALGATHTVVGRKGTSTTRLGEMRRGAIKRSAMSLAAKTTVRHPISLTGVRPAFARRGWEKKERKKEERACW